MKNTITSSEINQNNNVLEIHHLKKSFGELKILDDFNYVFKKNERIGIVGKNGVGKTTFLDIIMEKQSPKMLHRQID